MILSALWLPATLLAGALQAMRTAMQARLRGRLSVAGATLVRSLYGLPVAVALLGLYALLSGQAPPAPGVRFMALATLGAVLQLLATALLLAAFGHRNFVVGTAFSKTEAVQGAVVAWLVLGERLGPLAVTGLGLGLAGVLVLALAGAQMSRGAWARALVQPAALMGLGSGALFAITAVAIKAANLDLSTSDRVLAALVSLVWVVAAQSLLLAAWLQWREPGQLGAVIGAWRGAAPVGAMSAVGSACWFSAFALAPVALVRTVGQVEVVFTLALSHLYLGERASRAEVTGLLLITAGVVLAALSGVR